MLPSLVAPSGRIGQLTDAPDVAVPVQLPGNHTFSQLAGGFYHACGLSKPDGHLVCWGCWCEQDELAVLAHGRQDTLARDKVCAEAPAEMAGGGGFVGVAGGRFLEEREPS